MTILKTLNTSELFKKRGPSVNGTYYEFTVKKDCLETVVLLLVSNCESIYYFLRGEHYDFGNYVVVRHRNKLFVQEC